MPTYRSTNITKCPFIRPSPYKAFELKTIIVWNRITLQVDKSDFPVLLVSRHMTHAPLKTQEYCSIYMWLFAIIPWPHNT